MSKYDFFRIEGTTPVYMLLETELSRIGLAAETQAPTWFQKLVGREPEPSNPWAGFAYKNKALKIAGWDVDKDGSYTNDPDRAAKVLLKIGRVLGEAKRQGRQDDAELILQLLANSAS